MRKEVLWAIVAGIGFGLVIAFGVVRINSSLKPNNQKGDPTPAPKSNDVSEFKITLDKPENEDVVTSDSVTVSGITKGLTWITLSGENSDYIIQSNEKGFFEQDVDLTPGVNQIKVTAFDPQGRESMEKVLVVYSSSFETKTDVSTSQEDETASDEPSIREKIEQKVENLLNRPKAYLGTITDIADSTIQVRTKSGEIKQISTNKDEVVVTKDSGTSTKIVKFTDIAIGDFIVAMGYKNSNSVLSAQRILVTPSIEEPPYSSYLGKTATVGKKDIGVTTIKDGADKTITPDKNTTIFLFKDGVVTKVKITDIKEDVVVIFVNNQGEKSETTRSLFLISQS